MVRLWLICWRPQLLSLKKLANCLIDDCGVRFQGAPLLDNAEKLTEFWLNLDHLAVSFRFYANEVVNVVEEAAARGIPIVAISDSTLSPLAKSARVLFAVPEHEYTFSRSLAAPMCLAQALTVALAARIQNNVVDPRIPTVTGS